MATETVFTLGANHITVSDGESLSGVSQGAGNHLLDLTITLKTNDWTTVEIEDNNSNFSDSQGNNQTLTNSIDYNNTTYAAGLRVEAEYTLVVEDPDGNLYTLVAFNINEPGAANSYGTVEGLAFVGGVGGFPPIDVPLTVKTNQEGPSVPYSSLATPPCFVRGSWVATPDGPRLIEDLAAGDLVLTEDHGPQTLRFVSQTRLPAAALKAQSDLCPIAIKASAFGAGCPARDTMVSPQHRILISGWQAALLYGEDEVLVPAKKLCNDHTIRSTYVANGVEYFHLVFDNHEILTVDGLQSESFLPGAGLAEIAQEKFDLLALFGVETLEDIPVSMARRCVSDRSTELLA